MKDLIALLNTLDVQYEVKQRIPTNKVMVELGHYCLSIVKGEHTYGGPEGFYEIAPMTSVGREWAPQWFDVVDQGDDVLGWCTLDRVEYYINKILFKAGE